MGKWHKGYCLVCRRDTYIGKVDCLDLEICIDCFWSWQNGDIEIKQAPKICLNEGERNEHNKTTSNQSIKGKQGHAKVV